MSSKSLNQKIRNALTDGENLPRDAQYISGHIDRLVGYISAAMGDASTRKDEGSVDRQVDSSRTSPTKSDTLNRCREAFDEWYPKMQAIDPFERLYATWETAWNHNRGEISVVDHQKLITDMCMAMEDELAETEHTLSVANTIGAIYDVVKPYLKREIRHIESLENCPICKQETKVSYHKSWSRNIDCKGCGFHDFNGILGEPPYKTEIEGQKT